MPNSEPAVSVLIPVWKPHPEYLRAAIASILNQTLRDIELIIVEDPSPTPGDQVVAEFDDVRIRYYLNPTRTSQIAQRNLALRLARANLVALLDADDIAEPHRLETQVEFLASHPSIDVLGSQIAIIDQNGVQQAFRPFPLDHDSIIAAMKRFVPVCHPSVMYRKSTVLAAGGYEYDDYPAVEDFELWCRLAIRGARFANHSEPLTRYRIHAGQLKSQYLREIIRAVIAIKKMYWRDRMGMGDWIRIWAERCMLMLPPRLVLRLFMLFYYCSELPPVRCKGGDAAARAEEPTNESAIS